MTKQYSVLTAALTILLLTSATAFAGPIADANYTSFGIDFSMKSGVSSAVTLTVSGPGDFYVQQDFKAGQAPYLSIFDKAGQSLQAGIYTWSLTENLTTNGDRATAAKASGRTQDGAFTIEANGSLANPNLIESFDKAQTFATDLIVQGSACVGIDCTSSESFGSDTLRFKENNLRIHFNDTSSSGSFPKNDWRITINDSANGGAEYFSVDDATNNKTPFKIEANAQNNTLYVEADGDVGIKTANPVVDLHIVEGNTPTVRLDQDGSDGFGTQIWDIAGNETNFFIRDVTHSSNLVFRIKPSAPENSIFIKADGSIGLGTETPDEELDIEGDGPGFRLTNTGTAANGWRVFMNGNTGRLSITDINNSGAPFKFDAGANDNLFRVGINTAGTTTADTVAIGSTTTGDAVLQVQGSIVVDGVTEHADYVFEPDYDLNTIDEHVAFAMANKHLPGLPKAPEGLKGPVDLISHQMGILEELETAHLYIGQLHENMGQLHENMDQLQETIRLLTERLDEVEQ